MNRSILLLVIIMLATFLVSAGCAQEEKKDQPKDTMNGETTGTPETTQPAETEQVETTPTEVEIDVAFLQDYTNWELVKKDLASPAHNNAIKDVYVNSVGLDVFKSGTVPYPVGSIIVKENYANESGVKGSLAALTCMVKMEPGYDPENGDWAYVNTGPDKAATEKGKVAMCSSCHAQAKDKDFVYLTGGEQKPETSG